MAKMTRGGINRLRVAGMLFHGSPGHWQTTDGRFEIIRTFIDSSEGDESIPAWGVYDNALDGWVPGTDATAFETMREAVHALKSIRAEEDL